ncbi:uncharacterized protein LOC119830186 [Zerene cesonia]|uniref:uncharacterized protein LOC119830186 n=1 Tax=Zerene cesonia TaxID=33412 RepID=UPI0018E5476B|nr:uncharacterized protein LOC119830186 [Zerene cesonia]
MPLSPAQVAQAVALVDQGLTQREIATILNVPRSSMQYALKRYRETGSYSRRPGSGGFRCTSVRDDRFILLAVLRNRYLTAVEIRHRLQVTRGVNVSERTVRRRMEEVNLKVHRPARGPSSFLRQHRVARLQFAREHVNWSHEQWAKVLFTDECRFALRTPDDRERVWRRRGERFLSITTTKTVSFNGGSIMVWGGISSDARTELVIVNNRLTAARYIEEVLQEHVFPYSDFKGENHFLLMHDNTRPHVAHCVEEYLHEVGIRKLQWPARSPDLNPIEHIWNMLKRKIKSNSNPPETLDQLRSAAMAAWDSVKQLDIRNIIQSMPERMKALIRARGGNTRY